MDLSSMLWLIPALPLLGFTINALFGKKLPNPVVAAIAIAGPAIAFGLACLALASVHEGHGALGTYFTWIRAGGLEVPFGLQADALSAVMLMNVTGVGTLIHLYSYGYMKEDPGFSRFMSYLNLFLTAMLILVLGDNLLLLFVGWEGVGLCSFLLIGFWYAEPANTAASRKAFIVNRIGDFAFLIGLFTLFSLFGTVGFDGLAEGVGKVDLAAVVPSGALAGWTYGQALTLAAVALFGGATGKSAQLPLYVWLPDAMAGPTPVSALIHAATMVTAGVYLIARMDFLYALTPDVTTGLAVVAACTALLSGLIAMAQYDIKKVLAYSTVSQLGFMFVGMGTTFWHTGIFHVLTHAFFKALLFLGAGAVIHAMHHEQDMRKMGGLSKDLKIVFAPFLLGALALAGIWPFAGWWSKDEILGNALALSQLQGGAWTFIYGALTVTAVLTAFYTTRLIMMTFFGAPYAGGHDDHGHGHDDHGHGHDDHGHGHDDHGHGAHGHDDHGHGGGRHLIPVHWTMTSVLMALAVLAVFGGVGLVKVFDLEAFLEPVLTTPGWRAHLDHEVVHQAHTTAMWVSTVLALAAVGLGVALYGPLRATLDALVGGPLAFFRRIAEDKFYVDEIYEVLVVKPIGLASQVFFKVIDRALLDGLLVEGSGKAVLGVGMILRKTQSGAVSAATAATLFGTVAVLAWVVLHG